MIYVTLIWIVIFWFVGWLMAFFPGRITKALAIVPFIYSLPMIASKQVVWADTATGPQIVLVSAPALVTGGAFTLAMIFAFWSFWNWMESENRSIRSGLRKRKPKTVGEARAELARQR